MHATFLYHSKFENLFHVITPAQLIGHYLKNRNSVCEVRGTTWNYGLLVKSGEDNFGGQTKRFNVFDRNVLLIDGIT